MKNSLTEILRALRTLESPDDIIPVLGDEDAMKVMIAWSKTDQRWSMPRGKVPTLQAGNHQSVWSWIVLGWTFDHALIAKIAGVGPRVVHQKLEMLVGLRLIYPDGQMSKSARTALQVHVSQKLGIKPKRPAKKPDEPAAGGGENN